MNIAINAQALLDKVGLDLTAKTLSNIIFSILCLVCAFFWRSIVNAIKWVWRKKKPAYNNPIAMVVRGDYVQDLSSVPDPPYRREQLGAALTRLYSKGFRTWENDARRSKVPEYALRLLHELSSDIEKVMDRVDVMKHGHMMEYLRNLVFRIHRLKPYDMAFAREPEKAAFWNEGDSILQGMANSVKMAEDLD